MKFDKEPNCTVSKAPNFDIDALEETPPGAPEVIIESSLGRKTHKNNCPMVLANGQCGPLCSMLHTIDEKNSVHAKKVKLSLKFR